MAYDITALTLMENFGGGGPLGTKFFMYDTVDTAATVDTIGYISDGYTKYGMRKGDIVYVRGWTTAPPTALAERLTAAATANILTRLGTHVVIGVNSTTGAIDLSDVTAMTVTNTD